MIGVDGAPLSLIEPWARDGHLPGFSRLMEEGAWGPLRTILPPVTAPAWSSFMTGKAPGKHGVYEFFYRTDDSFQTLPVSSRSIDGAKLWDLIGETGRTVGVLNVPVTYPVSRVNGYVVSGLMTPKGTREMTCPPSLLTEIEREVGEPYRLYTERVHAKGRVGRLLTDYHAVLDYRIKTARHLRRAHPTDFFMVHFFGTDRIMHELWHCMDPTHPRHDASEAREHGGAILDYFRKVDGYLQEVLEDLDEKTTLMVMSDHGFGPLWNTVYLNVWLLSEGYLTLRPGALTRLKRWLFDLGATPANAYRLLARLGLAGAKSSIDRGRRDSLLRRFFLSFSDVDWSRSRAYAMGNKLGMVYVNLRGREPEGVVSPGAEYDALREELTDAFSRLSDPESGGRLFGRVIRGEEAYHGPHLDRAPDLLLIPQDFRNQVLGASDFVSNRFVEPALGMSGDHRMEGLVMMKGPGCRRGRRVEGARIIDLAPTLLSVMGVPVPGDMDGRVLTEAFEDAFAPASVSGPAVFSKRGEGPTEDGYSDSEAREVSERLRSLGYLD
ncbi:MAG: alkaline phosphatase family protein [Nitrospinota bacterium]|nr:alkaline phosphatase family protein [Nitrospinota bacterium]